jgi:hypothetical protein
LQETYDGKQKSCYKKISHKGVTQPKLHNEKLLAYKNLSFQLLNIKKTAPGFGAVLKTIFFGSPDYL